MLDLTQYPELIVRQQVEHLEVFTGIETENRYNVTTPQGDTVLYASEESRFLGRQFLRTHRPLTIHVVDSQGEPVLKASRAFFWFFSHLHVRDASDRAVGSLRRRFAIIGRRFTLEDSTGQPIAEIHGPLFRPNTFFIRDHGAEVARITKRWSGVLKESVTKADTFQITFDSPGRGQDFALLVLASAFAIDLDFLNTGKVGQDSPSDWVAKRNVRPYVPRQAGRPTDCRRKV